MAVVDMPVLILQHEKYSINKDYSDYKTQGNQRCRITEEISRTCLVKLPLFFEFFSICSSNLSKETIPLVEML